MNAFEKTSKYTWLTYLILASPTAIFSLAGIWILLRSIGIEEVGVIEEPERTPIVKAISTMSLYLLPVVYFLSLVLGHKLNNTRYTYIPFVANLLPIIGYLYIVYQVSEYAMKLTDGIVLYTALLAVLLTTGAITSILSTTNCSD